MKYFNKSIWKSRAFSSRLDCMMEEITSKTTTPIPQKKFLDAYFENLNSDMTNFLVHYKKQTTFEADYKTTSALRYDYDEKELRLRAFVRPLENSNTHGKAQIVFSKGLILALDDLMTRISCNKDFMVICAARKTRIWSGTLCFWPQSESIPQTRYLNYYSIKNKKFSLHISTELGKIFSGIPFGDDDRLYFSSLMCYLGLTWILFHEEAHYFHGHLDYWKDSYAFKAFQIDETQINLPKDRATMFKTFEWQADRNATTDIVTLFFSNENTPFELPEMFKTTNDITWYLRVLLVSLGAVVLLFQKAKIVTGSTMYYPSPETRLISIFGVLYGKLISMFREKKSVFGSMTEEQLVEAIIMAIRLSIVELYTIENIIINNTDYETELKVNMEDNAPDNLSFFDKRRNLESSEVIEKTNKIMEAFIKLESDDSEIDDKWFSEYRALVKNHSYVYDNILHEYRKKINSPYF